MDFKDKILELAKKIPQQLEHINTEEATKNALVMPFINALGYNVFDPTEVVPEFTADVGIKKGEKVDYAVMQSDKLIMLYECKSANSNLSQVHSSQLYRYFSVTDTRIGILTNGVEYHFHSDLDKPNKMDSKPFLVLNMLALDDRVIEELKRFSKPMFDVEDIMSTANDLKYRREIGNRIEAEFKSPSEEMVRLLANDIYEGRFTQTVLQEFKEITKQSFKLFINRQVNNRLKTALDEETSLEETSTVSDSVEENQSGQQLAEETKTDEREITTTQEELEAYFIIKTIMREVVDSKRITMRDTLSYCGIIFDDNNRKPICRLHFNRSQKYIGLFDKDKKEDRVPIDDLDDIYDCADRLKATATFYD